MGQNVAYVGGDGRHFLFGHLFDMRTQQDLTAAKLAQSDETHAEALWADAVPDRANDTTVLDRNLKLASQLGLRGTPMLIASDGRVSEGARSAEALDAWLTLQGREVASRTSVNKEQP
jgi:protein-disulfide isomerase